MSTAIVQRSHCTPFIPGLTIAHAREMLRTALEEGQALISPHVYTTIHALLPEMTLREVQMHGEALLKHIHAQKNKEVLP